MWLRAKGTREDDLICISKMVGTVFLWGLMLYVLRAIKCNLKVDQTCKILIDSVRGI